MPALILYSILAIYLFYPYINRFSTVQFLYVINPIAAALGAYILSRRWLYHPAASVTAGAAYGFGPFGLGFTGFHPLAGFSWMMLPWLLLPAVYWRQGQTPDGLRFGGRAAFSLLPFVWMVLLFRIAAQPWIGPFALLPLTASLTLEDFKGLIFPLHEAGQHIVFGLYPTAFVMALMGLFVYAKLQRIGPLIPVAVGTVLAFCGPVFQVSPVVWAAFPVLFLSLLSGLGIEALSAAGKADSKWVAVCAIFATVLSAFFGGLSIGIVLISPEVFKLTALLYGLAAAALWLLLCLIRLQLHWPLARWALLTCAAAIDLFLASRYFTAKLF
ncbi:MAG TPA: hypothetical protein PK525_05940 [Anaerohalosphaeraceae bacterium]|nr:hypothetical protein [Anaerohalosphaeraceae bacterium]